MQKLLPLITLACLISCQASEIRPADTKPVEVKAEQPEIDVTKPETLIGQSLEKVQAACDAAEVRHRVVEVDGKPRMVTRDYLPERLNFRVKAGLIIEVKKG